METNDSARSEFLREFPKTGPDTRAGKMLRHYWHPVCLSRDLNDLPYGVRMLGEDLVAFRGLDGIVGLVGMRCPHRCTSLEYGQIREQGLQCSYHGWTFDHRGHCVAMPLERAGSRAMGQISHLWYPVEEWGGVVWCYMGADKHNPPPLPKIDILTRTDGEIILDRGDFRNYNYLNFLENFADIGHSYVLHMLVPGTVPDDMRPYCNFTVNTDWRQLGFHVIETHFGMKSVVIHGTSDPELKYVNTWSIALPTHWRFGGITAGLAPDFTADRRESGGMLRIIDDTHFEIFRYTLLRSGNFRGSYFPQGSNVKRGVVVDRGTVVKKDYDYRKYPAWEGRPPLEDLVMQEMQGAIPPRETEHLVSTDVGVALLRRIWRKSMDDVAKGKAPKAVITDSEGVVEVDTFKGFAKAGEIEIGPKNMPSSKGNQGLIRDEQGRLVFA